MSTDTVVSGTTDDFVGHIETAGIVVVGPIQREGLAGRKNLWKKK